MPEEFRSVGLRRGTPPEHDHVHAQPAQNLRLVSSNDGWEQVETDIFCLHDYAAYRKTMARHFTDRGETYRHSNDQCMASCEGFIPKGKKALLVTEYGGIAFQDGGRGHLGPPRKVVDEEPFFARYKDVTDAVRAIPYCQGCRYTQLTDEEQETNGLMTLKRRPKIDPDRFRSLTKNPEWRNRWHRKIGCNR